MSSSYRKGLCSPWVINMSVLIGLCGVDWDYYETDEDWWALRFWTRMN